MSDLLAFVGGTVWWPDHLRLGGLGMQSKRLRCYLVRYTVDALECGWACVIDATEDEARRTVISHFDSSGADVRTGRVKTISLVEGAYVLAADAPRLP